MRTSLKLLLSAVVVLALTGPGADAAQHSDATRHADAARQADVARHADAAQHPDAVQHSSAARHADAAQHPDAVGPAAASPVAATARLVPPRIRIDPVALSRGPDVAVPYYDLRRHEIHDGTRVVAVSLPDGLERLTRVHGGYLALDHVSRPVTRVVSRTGDQRVLTALGGALDQTVSPDGRRVAAVVGPSRHPRLVLVRVSDGRVLHSRRMSADDYPAVTALQRDRALLSREKGTFWWRFGQHRLEKVTGAYAWTADLPTGRAAYQGRYGSFMSSVPRGRLQRWEFGPTEGPGLFAPDGSRVLAYKSEPNSRYGPDYVRIRVRSASTGDVQLAVFGSFGMEGFDQTAPRWETATTFLVLARQPADTVRGRTKVAWVRCTVTGSCENASPVFRVDESHPPYGPAPWVLATQQPR